MENIKEKAEETKKKELNKEELDKVAGGYRGRHLLPQEEKAADNKPVKK